MRLARPDKSIAVTHPQLIAEWHTANFFQPIDLSHSSTRIIIWQCAEGHLWQAPVNYRTLPNGKNKKCPYCAGRCVDNSNCLATTHPELAKQWYFSNAVTPDRIVANSTYKATWICEQGHIWSSLVYLRALRGYGCPYCAGVKLTDEKRLPIAFPDLIKEWHPDNILDPYELGTFSNERVKWICAKSHVWECTVSNRTRFNNGCPFCKSLRPTKETSLAATHPRLLAEWHPDNPIEPTNILPNSETVVKWICAFGHVYESTVTRRTNGKRRGGCPYCVGKKINHTNCVATLRPDLVSQWHPSNTVKLTEVSLSSSKRLLWVCEKGHEWIASVGQRKDHGCPFCSHRMSTPEDSLAITHPYLISEWHPSNTLKPTEVLAGSQKKILWICSKGHTWTTIPKSRTGPDKTGCPHCDRDNRIAMFMRINYPDWQADIAREESRAHGSD